MLRAMPSPARPSGERANLDVDAFESVSTWRQPEPQPASAVRTRLTDHVATQICRRGPGRLRVAVDGFTAAGKTSFGHELAAAIRRPGCPTMRASMDDFKNPWREARELGYDRVSGEGYYRNAYDFRSARELLDSVFAFRPEYNDLRDYRIWLHVDAEVSLDRGIARDAEMEGLREAMRVHRDRYHAAELIYLAEVDPQALADIIIDNKDFTNPRIRSLHG
jgi:uridine kinase